MRWLGGRVGGGGGGGMTIYVEDSRSKRHAHKDRDCGSEEKTGNSRLGTGQWVTDVCCHRSEFWFSLELETDKAVIMLCPVPFRDFDLTRVWRLVHISKPGLGAIHLWLCSLSGTERQTRERKVAGLSPCSSGRRNFFSRINFLCWL